MTIAQELQKPATSPYIEMYEIDGRNFHSSLFFHFTPSADAAFVFDSFTWTPFPIVMTGVEATSEQPNRPKLRISNITKIIQPYLQQYQNLVNVRVTRRRTLEKYLADGSEPNNTQQLPKEVYYIKTLTTHTRDFIEFELTTVFDLPGVKLPRAQALKDQTGGHSMYAPGLSTIRFRG